jgi:hypothetical protein
MKSKNLSTIAAHRPVRDAKKRPKNKPLLHRNGPCAGTIERTAYARALRQALRSYLALMEQEWGYRPVRVHFNIKGFGHAGQRIYVTGKAARGRRQPRHVARLIASEIADHRATCKECGLGIPALWARVSGWSGYFPQGLEDTPPDPVEKALHPIWANQLTRRLEAKKQQMQTPPWY